MFNKLRLGLFLGGLFLTLSAWGPGLYSTDSFGFYQSWQAEVCKMFCHRMPERSLEIHGVKTTACARCTGIVTGSLAGTVVVISGNAGPLLLTAAALNTSDAISGMLGGWSSKNNLRFVLGLSLGLLFSIVILQKSPFIAFSWKKRTF